MRTAPRVGIRLVTFLYCHCGTTGIQFLDMLISCRVSSHLHALRKPHQVLLSWTSSYTLSSSPHYAWEEEVGSAQSVSTMGRREGYRPLAPLFGSCYLEAMHSYFK